jgi:hypothetical protein
MQHATKFYDVVDELWLADLESLSSLDTADTAATIRELEAELLDVNRTRAYIATMVESIP